MEKNPALAAFLAAFETELTFGQVWIRRADAGFELRHEAEKSSPENTLRLVAETEIRPLAQFTAAGAFRPLKSAPHLQSGWRIVCRDGEKLGAALDKIYPGAIADWFAAQSPQPPVTSYREFTGRQTGMYRITTSLDDATAGAVIRACCHEEFCLKRRLWSADGLRPDVANEKSVIPCLEPCPILLEFARKMARLEKEGGVKPPTNDEAAVAVAETDFDAPGNPRRVRFVLEKQGGGVKPISR
jgi:hypothetical protein